MVKLAKYILFITALAVGIYAVDIDSYNETSSSVVSEFSSIENVSQVDGGLEEESFIQDVFGEFRNFFNSVFGEQDQLILVEPQVSEAPANIKRAVFDMNGIYSEEVAPEPSSNEYFDPVEPTGEVALQEQKEKMAFNLAMTFKNAAKKKALNTSIPSRISRLLAKRGYYKSHKRFTRSVKDLPIEDDF